MPWDLLIRGGEVVTRGGVARADLAIEAGQLVECAAELRGAANDTIDATSLHVLPGLIDPHVHFNEPRRTDWEGIATGSAALAAGGGTCFFDMPLNSSPPTLDGASFDLKHDAALRSSLTDFALWGGLTPTNLDRLEELAERGVIGFKAFMSGSGIDDFDRADDATLLDGMQISSRLNLPVAVHAESEEITSRLTRDRSGNTWRDYLATRPIAAELDAIGRAIAMARETKCRLHIVHVSSAAGVDLVVAAALSGVDVTCETCPHYLLLNEDDLQTIGARAKCAPPLRTADEVVKLWDALLAGKIAFIASDHSPAPASLKTGDDVFAIWGGIAGVQSTLASVLTRLPLPRVCEITSANVAARFGIERKGRIEIGYDADLTLVDLRSSFALTRDMLLDRHKLSPYVGRSFTGCVVRTISRGRTIFLNGQSVGTPAGRLVTPCTSRRTEKPAHA